MLSNTEYGSLSRPIVVDDDELGTAFAPENVVDSLNLSPSRKLQHPTPAKRLIGSPVIFSNGVGGNYVSDSHIFHSRANNAFPSMGTLLGQNSQHAVAIVQNRGLPPRHRRTTNLRFTEREPGLRSSDVLHLVPDSVAAEMHISFPEHGDRPRVSDCPRSMSQSRAVSACSSASQNRVSSLHHKTSNLSVDYSVNQHHQQVGGSTQKLDLADLEDDDDPFRYLKKDIYSDHEESDSDASVLSSPKHVPTPMLAKVGCLSPDAIAERRGFHLSKAFELGTQKFGEHEQRRMDDTKIGQSKVVLFPDAIHPSRRSSRADLPEKQVLTLPKVPYNRPRRILLPKSSVDLPILTVTMRADVQFFDALKRHRISRFSIPNNSTYRHVVDAIVIGDTAIISYGDGPHQASLVHFKSQEEGHTPFLTDMTHDAHKLSLDAVAAKGKRAVSCITARGIKKNTLQFFTGGYDKTIKLWSIGKPDLVSSSETLTKLTTIPEALAFRDKSLIIGTSRKILTIDLTHLSSIPVSAQLSSSVCQIHVHNQAPNLTILEVNSLDFQVHIFDDRIRHGFDRVADCYFGARQTRSVAKCNRGDTNFSLFVKGYDDGTVRLWDYRNPKKPLLTRQFQGIGNVVHTVFKGPNVLCYGENNLSFLDTTR
ncbi:hypothetical protein CPB84DRAFT_57730 [Gymnopilus junonius]|uniref:WD40 repeat-like protein n=1 Tax=Gymnopilus junonius TaxID=109634 RepID=A0A9P5P4U4_GYMJU|nr:hypothetical protein CPB84DRAFT_57730 [Gymnopilus junonius]